MNEPGEPGEPPEVRASDADRERVAQILHRAMGEGRLTTQELEERLSTLYASKTMRELQPLTADLPTAAANPAAAPVPVPHQEISPDRFGGTPTGTSSVAILSGSVRKGAWVMPGRFTAVAVMGGVELDLTEVRFAEQNPVINIFALMGGVDIRVPDDVHVQVDVTAFMGGVENKLRSHPPAGSPTVRITGFVMMGGVEVKPSKPRKHGRKQLEG